jgi:hypothetical protein
MTEDAEPSLRGLAELIARIAGTLHAGGDDATARTQAAADVDRLQALVGETEQQRTPGSPAGFDLAQVSGALRVFTEWLRTPTAANEAKAERAMSELAATVGPLVGWDPAREDAAKRAQYRREARAALDELFADVPKKP